MKAGLTINVCMSICDIDSYQVFVMLILQQFELICFRISLLKFYAASTRQLQFGNPASQNHFSQKKYFSASHNLYGCWWEGGRVCAGCWGGRGWWCWWCSGQSLTKDWSQAGITLSCCCSVARPALVPPVTTRSAQPSVAGRESSLAALLGFSRASTAEVAWFVPLGSVTFLP